MYKKWKQLYEYSVHTEGGIELKWDVGKAINAIMKFIDISGSVFVVK